MRPLLPLALLALLVDCSDGTDSGAPPTFAIRPAAQWSGGAVEVSSRALAGSGVQQFTIAGTSRSAVRLNDTTVSLTLPVLPGGPVALIRVGAQPETVGVVEVSGFRSAREVSGTLGFEPLVPEAVSPPVFLAEGAGGGFPTLSILDPATDQVTTISGIGPVQTSFGVMPSFQADRFVLRDSLNRLGTWELSPAPTLLQLSPYQTALARHQTQLGDTVWLTTFKYQWEVTRPSGSSVSGNNAISNPFRMVFSPSGNRLVMAIDFVPAGQRLPVFDGTTGDTVFTLPLRSAHGVAFSTTGSLMYVGVAWGSGTPDSLISASALSGQRLAAVALPAGFTGWALTFDPTADRLYQVADSSGTAALFVFDGTSLALQGRLGCPGPCGNSSFWSAGLAVDPAVAGIYVAYPGTPIPVLTFDRLP